MGSQKNSLHGQKGGWGKKIKNSSKLTQLERGRTKKPKIRGGGTTESKGKTWSWIGERTKLAGQTGPSSPNFEN